MFVNLYSSQSRFAAMAHGSLWRLLFAALLLVALPIFIWAVATQRIELRKKAATSEPPIVCWNKVGGSSPNLYWPDGCMGAPYDAQARICTQATVPLTPSEQYQYGQWVNAGKPILPGCTPSTTYPINWKTQDAMLSASSMTIEANGKVFIGKPDQLTPMALHSDPGNYNYMTLEATWQEQNTPMRVYFYFSSDCTTGAPPLTCNTWRVTEVRIYNGKNPGDWFTYTPSDNSYAFSQMTAPWGQRLVIPTLTLSSSAGGVHVLTFNNFSLQPFLQQTPTVSCGGISGQICPSGMTCQYESGSTYAPYPDAMGTCVPTSTRDTCIGAANGTACINRCASACPPGQPCTKQCVVRSGICMNQRCETWLTPTPTAITCVRRAPSIIIQPDGRTGRPGDTRPYTVIVTNTDSAGCPNSAFSLRSQVSSGWNASLSTNIQPNIAPGQTANISLNVQSATSAAPSVYPISVYVKNATSQLESRDDASYTVAPPVTFTPTPTPSQPPSSQTMTLRMKLAGVIGAEANGAKVGVKFVQQNGSTLQLSAPLSLSHVGNGVYQTSAVITNPFVAGTKFRVKLKGEKHVAIEFCRQTGQTSQCADGEFITMPSPTPSAFTMDFTGIALPPGDLSIQDGRADINDLNKLNPLMAKLCGSLTTAEKLVGDLNYDGCVTVRDVFLLLQTLETRYDE
jgi:hypothetical protein